MMDIIDLPNNMEGFLIFTYSEDKNFGLFEFSFLLNVTLLPTTTNIIYISLKQDVTDYTVKITTYDYDPILGDLETVFARFSL